MTNTLPTILSHDLLSYQSLPTHFNGPVIVHSYLASLYDAEFIRLTVTVPGPVYNYIKVNAVCILDAKCILYLYTKCMLGCLYICIQSYVCMSPYTTSIWRHCCPSNTTKDGTLFLNIYIAVSQLKTFSCNSKTSAVSTIYYSKPIHTFPWHHHHHHQWPMCCDITQLCMGFHLGVLLSTDGQPTVSRFTTSTALPPPLPTVTSVTMQSVDQYYTIG